MADDAKDVDKIYDQRSPDSTSSRVCTPAKKKRKRSLISDDQVAALDKHYIQEKWPSKLRKQAIADELGRQSQFVTIWFQNRRARDRRRLKRHHASPVQKEKEKSPAKVTSTVTASSTWFPKHIFSESAQTASVDVVRPQPECINSGLSNASSIPTANATVCSIAPCSTWFPMAVLSKPAWTASINRDQLVSEGSNAASCVPDAQANAGVHDMLLPSATLSTLTSLTWSTLRTDPNPIQHTSKNSMLHNGNLSISSSQPVPVMTTKPAINAVNSDIHTTAECRGLSGALRSKIAGGIYSTPHFFDFKPPPHSVFEMESLQVKGHLQHLGVCTLPSVGKSEIGQDGISQIHNSVTHKRNDNSTHTYKQKITMNPLITSKHSIATPANLSEQIIHSALVNEGIKCLTHHVPNSTIDCPAYASNAISTFTSQYIQEQSTQALHHKAKRSFKDNDLSNIFQSYVLDGLSYFKPVHQSQQDDLPSKIAELNISVTANNRDCTIKPVNLLADVAYANRSEQITIVEDTNGDSEHRNTVLKNATLVKGSSTWSEATRVFRDTNNTSKARDNTKITDTGSLSSRMTTNISNTICIPKRQIGIHSSGETSASIIQIPTKSNTPTESYTSKKSEGLWNMPAISHGLCKTDTVYPTTTNSNNLEYGDRIRHCNMAEDDVEASRHTMPITLPLEPAEHQAQIGKPPIIESQTMANTIGKIGASVICRNLCFGKDTENSTTERDAIVTVKKPVSTPSRKKIQCTRKRPTRLIQNLTEQFQQRKLTVPNHIAAIPTNVPRTQPQAGDLCITAEQSLTKESSITLAAMGTGGDNPQSITHINNEDGKAYIDGRLTSGRNADEAVTPLDCLGDIMASTNQLCENNLINDNWVNVLDNLPSTTTTASRNSFPGLSHTSHENRHQTDEVCECKVAEIDKFLNCNSQEESVVNEEHHGDVDMNVSCKEDECKRVVKSDCSLESVEKNMACTTRAGAELSEPACDEMTLFIRVIGMAAAAEGGLLDPHQPHYAEAVSSALYGIPLKNNCRLVYDKEYGFDTEPMCNDLS